MNLAPRDFLQHLICRSPHLVPTNVFSLRQLLWSVSGTRRSHFPFLHWTPNWTFVLELFGNTIRRCVQVMEELSPFIASAKYIKFAWIEMQWGPRLQTCFLGDDISSYAQEYRVRIGVPLDKNCISITFIMSGGSQILWTWIEKEHLSYETLIRAYQDRIKFNVIGKHDTFVRSAL